MTVSARLRAVQAKLLVKPSARVVRWIPLAAIAPLGFVIVRTGLREASGGGEEALVAAGILLAVWMGFVLDDPAAESVSAVPTPLLFRRAIRIAVSVPVAWAQWGALSIYAAQGWKTPSLATAFAAQVMVALGCAAVGIRVSGEGRGGLFAVGGLFVVFFLLPLIFGIRLSLDPVSSTWGQRYGRWIVIGGAGFLTFLVSSDGPGRRGIASLLGRLRSRPPVVAGERAR